MFCSVLFNFLAGCTACGTLVPQPGIEPMPPALEAQSLNHWIAGKSPLIYVLNFFPFYFALSIDKKLFKVGIGRKSLKFLMTLIYLFFNCIHL